MLGMWKHKLFKKSFIDFVYFFHLKWNWSYLFSFSLFRVTHVNELHSIVKYFDFKNIAACMSL